MVLFSISLWFCLPESLPEYFADCVYSCLEQRVTLGFLAQVTLLHLSHSSGWQGSVWGNLCSGCSVGGRFFIRHCCLESWRKLLRHTCPSETLISAEHISWLIDKHNVTWLGSRSSCIIIKSFCFNLCQICLGNVRLVIASQFDGLTWLSQRWNGRHCGKCLQSKCYSHFAIYWL